MSVVEEEMECVGKEGEEEEEESDSEDSEIDEDDIIEDEGLSEEREDELRSKVKELRIQITSNNLFYDGHVNLIAALRELMELEEARNAREAMSIVYPLSPELWLEWLRDEQKVCTTNKEREYIVSLFDRAVKDYTSVQIWVEYVMFMLGGGDMSSTRAVGDRALTAVGTHVSEGVLVWQVVLLVEKQVYASLQKPGGIPSEQDKKEQDKQLRRIQNLFRRQARVPLLNTDPNTLLEEASVYFEGNIEPQMKTDMEKTQKKLAEKIPFEDELLKCDNEAEKLAIYRRYINHANETDNPAVVQSLYERAVTDHCLDAGLWEDYVRYALRQFQGLEYVVLPLCERSQRNCPWSASLCVLHIRALQLFAGEDNSDLPRKVKGALEKGLGCGLQSGSEATRMWMAYLSYLRRLIDWEKEHDVQLDAFLDACQQAVDMIDNSFGEEGDIDSEIPRFWARVVAELARSPEMARTVWNDIIMKRNNNFKNANFWLEFINIERSYGSEKHARKLFRRALERVWDHVELIGDAYHHFEQEVGTFETMEDFIRRYEDRMVIVKKKRAEDEAKLEEQKQVEEARFGKQRDRGKKVDKFEKKNLNTDRQANGKLQGATSVFKVPHQISKRTNDHPPVAKTDPGSQLKSRNDHSQPSHVNENAIPPPGFKKDLSPPPGFKSNVLPPPGFKSDVEPPPGFKNDTEPPPGFKSDVAPPPGYKRRAEESEDESQAKKAKISEQYGILVEKSDQDDLCTAFISNLEFTVDKQDIIPLFAVCGEIKDFRLVRDFRQRSKGYGYLVFRTQSAVMKALEMDRIPLNGRPVFVSKYDPDGQSHQFKFSRELEKNKLFVRGLPFDMSQEDVKEAFLPHGEIKDIRLVSFRNGFSKGTCYIDYHSAEVAENVRQAMDGKELRGKVLSVLISNPPITGKNKLTNPKPVQKEVTLGGGSKGKNIPGVRKKGMFDLMPRSLMRASGSSSTPDANKPTSDSSEKNPPTTDSSEKPKSNEDFRKYFLNKS